ncbi:Structural maintenance of chromosomes protein 2 [Danaus plexippus plexippus]|uniref:Structural maintenance of chromosomes protein n=1 Tax=Danaus plexippus plexippus TaxID=278856 RepID=A0A212EVY2_DANPL|nr:Structural maintenance of chromosomes protein 2 [Danaus plexippus plexippus]
MYIKSITLDGFKSYGNRVEVNGFDPEFNAITGLNGTGKSNILDSICFVLGITNLSNVRAGSLQELIYKHGQAGITKATVSITFDNRDKRQCPIGYENHDEITVTRQVVMGGKNKYLINGINVQNKRVSDLFCSVQLNVNNPHFLIMQGRITKVLNMKPPEILSMVEEAAGTRMYEAKKQAAQKTIEKKDAKLRELNDIIREDIAPKLQKLQDERSQFQEYQKVVRELENLTRLYVAWKYVSAEESAKEAANKVTEVQDEIKDKKEMILNNEKEAKEYDKKIAALNKKLDEESGSVLRELETELQAAEKTEAKSAADWRAAQGALTTHHGRARLASRALDDDRAALRDKEAQLHEVSSTFDRLREACTTSEARLAATQARFLAVSAGNEDASESLQDQLIAAKQKASEASTRISQSQMEKKHAEDRLVTLEKEFKSSSAQYQRDMEGIARHRAEVAQLEAQLSSSTFSADRRSALQDQLRALRAGGRERRDRADQLAARLQRCHFKYTPPTANFDSNKVSGTVCRLIDVRDPKYCTALETAAGGRLYNVVVDTDETSKLLLQRGQLQSRTTIIPLNRISSQPLSRETVALAQKIGGGPSEVQLALDLIDFPPSLRPAMSWVFGNTLVCSSLEAARRVTFDPRVRCRSVTLDGDVFDPAGTLSGGARARGGSLLLELKDLKHLERQLAEEDELLATLTRDLDSMQHAADQHAALQQRLEMSRHALAVSEERAASTATAQLHAEIQALKDNVARLTAAVEEDGRTRQETAARARELELKVKDIKGHRERRYKKAEEELKLAKKEAEQHTASWRQREQEHDTLRLELDELRRAVDCGQQALERARDSGRELEEALERAREIHDAHANEVKEIQTKIKIQKAEIASRSGEVAALTKGRDELLGRNRDLELDVKQLEYRCRELQQEAAEGERKIKSLVVENPWIPSERQYFGLSGGAFEFGRDVSSGGARLAQLRDRKDRLARGLNARAHTLLGKEEEQYQDVMRKKKIVEADRAKLVQVMAELDDKKRRTLLTACEQVNRDFGSIFSSLLPGAQARLTPPPGQNVLDGLEVKIGFNNTWKESLGELSGGQRSLVALSLVLALLLFRPAPLYILDEVDAALDLSHTQNIGRMLKEHFTHSQFIIVSLKDGMFNNANVLFRTRFADGMSAVTRTDNRRDVEERSPRTGLRCRRMFLLVSGFNEISPLVHVLDVKVQGYFNM